MVIVIEIDKMLYKLLYIVGPERKGPYVTFCQIEKIGFKVQNSRKNNFSYKKIISMLICEAITN